MTENFAQRKFIQILSFKKKVQEKLVEKQINDETKIGQETRIVEQVQEGRKAASLSVDFGRFPKVKQKVLGNLFQKSSSSFKLGELNLGVDSAAHRSTLNNLFFFSKSVPDEKYFWKILFARLDYVKDCSRLVTSSLFHVELPSYQSHISKRF